MCECFFNPACGCHIPIKPVCMYVYVVANCRSSTQPTKHWRRHQVCTTRKTTYPSWRGTDIYMLCIGRCQYPCRLCSCICLGYKTVWFGTLGCWWWHSCLPVSTGFELRSESSSNWRSSSTELFTILCLGTCVIGWTVLPTWHLGVDFCRQLPVNLLFVHRVLSQLANDHLLLLARDQSCGTVFQMTLHLLHHLQCFGETWKPIYFGSHIRTLLRSLFVVVLAMVVGAVIYLGHFKIVM